MKFLSLGKEFGQLFEKSGVIVMKKLVDLSRSYFPNMPEAYGHRNFEIERYTNPKTNSRLSFLKFTSHTGTHIDAPFHFIDGGETIDQFNVEEFTGIGYTINLLKGSNEAITLPEIEENVKQFSDAKFLFIRTGWEEKWNMGDKEAYVNAHPYIEEEAARFLASKIKFLGIDTISPEATFSSGKRLGSPVHEILLSKRVLIIENLCGLKEVTGYRFLVYAFPLNLIGTDGAPARVVAEKLEEVC